MDCPTIFSKKTAYEKVRNSRDFYRDRLAFEQAYLEGTNQLEPSPCQLRPPDEPQVSIWHVDISIFWQFSVLHCSYCEIRRNDSNLESRGSESDPISVKLVWRSVFDGRSGQSGSLQKICLINCIILSVHIHSKLYLPALLLRGFLQSGENVQREAIGKVISKTIITCN